MNSLTGHFSILVHPKSYFFFDEFIHESTIFPEFKYEFWEEFFARLLGTPEFKVFHQLMPEVIYFGLFYVGSYSKIVEILSEEYSEENREKYSDFMELIKRILHWIDWRVALTHSILRNQVILPLLLQSHLPHCQPVWQSYSAYTCHLGRITHSVLAASAPSAAPTWI